jgi:sarcosine oxidase, subunit gamma
MTLRESASMADAVITATAARHLPPVAGALVSVGLTPPATRFSFRGDSDAVEACAEAFACALPLDACRAAEAGDRAALWLGPDEWLLLAPEAETAELFAGIEAALATVPHALVDISHRQVGFTVSGPEAATLLNSGCPLDLELDAFPVGMCTRTILGKCDVTLWRKRSDCFRLEVNRSFADYLAMYLRVAERGIG